MTVYDDGIEISDEICLHCGSCQMNKRGGRAHRWVSERVGKCRHRRARIYIFLSTSRRGQSRGQERWRRKESYVPRGSRNLKRDVHLPCPRNYCGFFVAQGEFTRLASALLRTNYSSEKWIAFAAKDGQTFRQQMI